MSGRRDGGGEQPTQMAMLPPTGVLGRDSPAGEPCSTGPGWTTSESCPRMIRFPFSRTVSHLFLHLVIGFAGWSNIIRPILWMSKLILKKEQKKKEKKKRKSRMFSDIT